MLRVLKTYGKTDGKHNIYNFTLKIFVYLNLCYSHTLEVEVAKAMGGSADIQVYLSLDWPLMQWFQNLIMWHLQLNSKKKSINVILNSRSLKRVFS